MDREFEADVRRAWIQNRMERDRSVLALSTAGAGLMVSLLTTTTVWSSFQFWLQVCGGLSFAASILAAVAIFHCNAQYLRSVLLKKDDGSKKLRVLDAIMLMGFVVGIVLATGAAIVAAVSRGGA
jgi:hypothetical protein